ncbi:MAG TPA: glycosyltransferase, partial [Rhodothermales bacterium]|nr:glycosyltransferase [Rhodothermales bacterium]
RADLCGLAAPLFYDPEAGRAWRYRYAGRRPWVAGGTMLYRRSLWAERPFDDVNDGEDTRFVWRLRPERVLALPDPAWFVGLVHAGGSSRKQLHAPRWQPRPADEVAALLGADAAYYTGARPLPVAPAPAPAPPEPPRVTVSIPTYGTPTHLRHAVESILAQTYPHLRVIVVADGGVPPWDALDGIDDPRLFRFSLEENGGRYFADAVVLAASDDPLFMVQDADDWSEPDRVATLLARLESEGADVAYAASFMCHEATPEDRWVQPFPALLEAPGEVFVHRAHHPAALYRAPALRAVGGPYGGMRIGYDSLLVNLLVLTARVAYEERALTTYRLCEGSLTRAPETGLGSAARDAAWDVLNARYQEARALHEAHRAGAFRADTLATLVGQRAGRGVTPEAQAALAREAARLRGFLTTGSQSEGEGIPAAVVRAPAPDATGLERLLDDPGVPWSGWTVSKGLARALAAHLEQHRPARVLETGSGVSTLVLARYAARHGAAVTVLEHDPAYWERTADLLAAHGLGDAVDLRYAPLAETPDGPWYDAALDGSFDFVFADGPPLSAGRTAVLPALHAHLADGWTLWLKDGRRPHERACVEYWSRRFPLARRLWDGDPRGVWVLSAEEPAPRPVVTRAPRAVPREAGDGARGGEPVLEKEPLVSCLMPTRDRRPFVAQAIRYFLRQDYPHRELVVVDDGDDPVEDLMPDDPRIVYVRLPGRASIGAKRNVAGDAARGEVLLCWDDDDWYGAGRLRAQVGPLVRGEADVTALGRSPFLCIPTGRFWQCSARIHARMFYKQVVGGTLAFRRGPWRAGARFPDGSLAEDAALLRDLLHRGARLAPIVNRDLFVYIRHDANSWRFQQGSHLDRQGWNVAPWPAGMPEEDRAFYRALREARAVAA